MGFRWKSKWKEIKRKRSKKKETFGPKNSLIRIISSWRVISLRHFLTWIHDLFWTFVGVSSGGKWLDTSLDYSQSSGGDGWNSFWVRCSKLKNFICSVVKVKFSIFFSRSAVTQLSAIRTHFIVNQSTLISQDHSGNDSNTIALWAHCQKMFWFLETYITVRADLCDQIHLEHCFLKLIDHSRIFNYFSYSS